MLKNCLKKKNAALDIQSTLAVALDNLNVLKKCSDQFPAEAQHLQNDPLYIDNKSSNSTHTSFLMKRT